MVVIGAAAGGAVVLIVAVVIVVIIVMRKKKANKSKATIGDTETEKRRAITDSPDLKTQKVVTHDEDNESQRHDLSNLQGMQTEMHINQTSTVVPKQDNDSSTSKNEEDADASAIAAGAENAAEATGKLETPRKEAY